MNKISTKCLDRYIVKRNKNNEYHAFDIITHKQVRGISGINIVYRKLNFSKNLDKRINHKAKSDYCQISNSADDILMDSLCHHKSAYFVVHELGRHAHFTVPFHCDYYTPEYTKLYRIHISSKDICKKFGVSSIVVYNMFKILRHYGYAIIHYGNITFSPLLFYSKSIALKIKALNYYRKLLSNDKYGERYLNNPVARMKSSGLIK